MEDMVTIAVDALGGDAGAAAVLPGVELALLRDPALQVLLCGPADVVEPFAAGHERCEAVPCTEEIGMGEHPASAVRKKKDSSIVVGCRLVKEGRAQGFFSAGSTGACLVAGTLVMGRVKGVARPALCAVVPAPTHPVVMCDVGANADCTPEYLVQFAQMAIIYAEQVLGRKDPKAALLNIGAEEAKGSDLAQKAHALLRERVPQFAGNAEGCDVVAGAFDVIVCDGFSGNVCLKTIEGTAKVLFSQLKDIFYKNTRNKLAAAAIRGDLGALRDRMSSETYGGAPLLGVRGACIVGHGASGVEGIANGVLTAAKTARLQVSDLIAQTIAG